MNRFALTLPTTGATFPGSYLDAARTRYPAAGNTGLHVDERPLPLEGGDTFVAAGRSRPVPNEESISDEIQLRLATAYPGVLSSDKLALETQIRALIKSYRYSYLVQCRLDQGDRQKLTALLLSLFQPSELNREIGYSSLAEIRDSVPQPTGISPMDYMTELVNAVIMQDNPRRALTELFNICKEKRPYRRQEITTNEALIFSNLRF